LHAASDVIIIAHVKLNQKAPVQRPSTTHASVLYVGLDEKEDNEIEVFSIKNKLKEAILFLMSNGQAY